MAAKAPPSGGSLLSALDFFGKTDAEGVEKFKTIAFRALHEQKLEEELQRTKQENERLKEANAHVTRELNDLQVSFDANIDDRERVLAFKSKRIEELYDKLREFEAIKASLVQTINGTGSTDGDGTLSLSNTSAAVSSFAEPTETERETRARMMTLVNAGRPLFHALDTCKEQEYKQLYEKSQREHAQLIQTALENDAIMRETRLKQDSDTQINQLQAQLAAMALEKDELEHHLERKLILEKDRLRREKETELQGFRDTMRLQMRMQLDVTTQRTVEENERLQLELRYQSSQLEKMIKHFDELRVENKRAKQEMHVFEEMNAELSRKLKFYEHLFAKMQQKDQQQSNQVVNQELRTPSLPLEPPSSRRTPRKLPLPALSTGATSKAKPPASPSLYGIGSPPASSDADSHDLLLDPVGPQSPYQLDTITDALKKHLQSREFTKKQVVAVLRYHRDRHHQRESPKHVRDTTRLETASVVKKKLMLAKVSYAPASYRRRIREPPMTLDALIKQKTSARCTDNNQSSELTIDDEQHRMLQALLLPEITKKKEKGPQSPAIMLNDSSEIWKFSASRPREHYNPPATAKF